MMKEFYMLSRIEKLQRVCLLVWAMLYFLVMTLCANFLGLMGWNLFLVFFLYTGVTTPFMDAFCITRYFAFTDEVVQIFRWNSALPSRLEFREDTRSFQLVLGSQVPSFLSYFGLRSVYRPVRRIKREELVASSVHRLNQSWGCVIVQRKGCKPRGESSTLLFVLRNFWNVFCIFADLDVAIRYNEILEQYIANSEEIA